MVADMIEAISVEMTLLTLPQYRDKINFHDTQTTFSVLDRSRRAITFLTFLELFLINLISQRVA